MEIIPVIDLKGGLVVHARRGDRANYRPIETPLATTAEPLDVVAGLMRLHPFAKLYIADLDAIAGRDGHTAAIRRIGQGWPRAELWTDRGSATEEDIIGWRGEACGRLVLGSESQSDTGLTAALRDDPSLVLSLDFRGDVFQGPPELLDTPSLWPRRVIVMTLARVGSNLGPDLAKLGSVLERAEGREVYAAGGLRHAGDGRALKALGVAGVLVATALHDGRLPAPEIRSLGERGGRQDMASQPLEMKA